MNKSGNGDGNGVPRRAERAPAAAAPQEKERPESQDTNEDKPQGPPPHKRPGFIIALSILVLAALIGGLLYWLHSRQFVSTDDAYIDGHITQIAPRISAQVVALHVDDNQFVHKGELMPELDPTDFEVAQEQAAAQLAEAQGRLAQSQAQRESAKASVEQSSAERSAAQVTLDNATRDLNRYQSVDERARSRQQLDNAATAQKNAQAQLDEAKAKEISAHASVTTSVAAVKASEGEVKVAEAGVRRPEVNLSYCKIYAPVEGRVTQRTVDVGNYVQAGQALFMLVSPDVWVTANFKETQLKRMRPGQPVTIKVDAFSGLKFNGRVDSIQAGSGARFGVLPAENATGNFVKIVQRVPVKILFDHGENTNDVELLSPGLSVIPQVRVR